VRKKDFPLDKVYRLLEPGPVVLLTTARAGRPNVMTLSWHVMLDFEPPLVGLVVSRRNFSHGLLRTSKQCVINVPDEGLASAVVGAGNCSGREQDKFKRFGLTRVPSTRVRPPGIAECFASLECRVVDLSDWTSTTCSSSRWSRPGPTPARRPRARSITAATGPSWSPAAPSACRRR
jgi:flavin reductase (DIM6/NTAB) family NADH-FMN oxidoreductase RutF